MTKTFVFPLSPVFIWIKGKIEVGDRITTVTTRNTILGIIPAGADKQTIPMSNVSSVITKSSIKIWRLLVGLMFFLGAFGIGSVLDTIIMLLIGIALIIAAFPLHIEIQTAGTTKSIYAPAFARSTLTAAADAMNEAMLNTENRKDVASAADRIVDAIDHK